MGSGAQHQPLTRARLRQLQQLQTAKGRREQQAFLLDGLKLVRDALASAAPITEILSLSPEEWANAPCPVLKISQADSERLSDTRTPQGHFAVVEDHLRGLATPLGESWQVVALDAIQDAGNVGGIIRSAAAFEAARVIAGPGSADPTHPRVTRAATGAWFRIPIARSDDLRSDLEALRNAGGSVLAAEATGEPLEDIDVSKRAVWLFGNEGTGISAELQPLIDKRVSVPIAEGVDSLNVNVAAGIILHHGWQRFRERKTQ